MPVSKKRKGAKKYKHKNKNKLNIPNDIMNLENVINRMINDEDQPDEMKLSNKLIELISPWIDTTTDIRTLIDIACIAWNMSVDEEFSTEIGDLVSNSSIEYDEHDEMIVKLKARKMELFPEDYRKILHAKVHFENDKLDIVVMSELKPEYFEKMFENIIEHNKSTDK